MRKHFNLAISILISLTLILLTSCAMAPGISEKPNLEKNNSINPNIKVVIHDLNQMDFDEINEFKNKYVPSNSDDVALKYNNFFDYTYEYQLGSGDEITLNLTETDDIDGSYLIDPFGNIDLPYVGKINLNNYSAIEAQNLLMNVLKQYYINPDLQLNIITFKSSKVYVTGTVRNQLIIDLDDNPIRILDAMIRANVNTTGNDNLSSTTGVIRRDGQVYALDLKEAITGEDEKKNFYLKKDDVIFIDRNPNSIIVFGEANFQGSYFPYAGYNLTQVLSDSGLNNLTADAEEIFVIRENFEEDLTVNVFQINIKNPINLVSGKYFELQAKDIIYIPATDLVKWNRVISLLLPQTDLFKSYNPIIQNGLSANNVDVQ